MTNSWAKIKKDVAGVTGFTAIYGLVVVLGILIIVYLVSSPRPAKAKTTDTSPSSSSQVSTSQTQTNAYAILPPATVPPKVAECSQTLSFSSDGNSGPISCSSGDLNVLAWQALSGLEPKVMTLGYDATASQVQSALCADTGANVSNIIEQTNYQISVLYYGWSFSSNPSVVLTNGSCVNVDDN